MKLEDLEKNLYKKNQPKDSTPQGSEPLNLKKKTEIETGWPEEKILEEKLGGGKQGPGFWEKIGKIWRWPFWILIVVAFGALALAGYFFYHSSNSSNLAFSLSVPSDTLLAVPFDLNFDIKNSSKNTLNDVKISMILPEGTGFVGEDPDQKRALDKSLGDLNQDAEVNDKIPLIIFSDGQSVKRFEVKISYFTPSLGSSVRFEETKDASVAVKEPALKLDLSAPQKVLNSEDFEVDVRYENISSVDFSNVKLKMSYPDFFTFKKASVNSSFGNNTWELGNLAKNSGQSSFTIDGKVLSANQSNFNIKGTLTAEVAGQKYVINEKTASLEIVPSPLSLSILLNNQPNFMASLRNNLNYKIFYNNSSPAGLNDVVIQAKLTGAMFDITSLQGSGFFDSKSNTITWNAANTPSLSLLSAGGSGSVSFQIQTKDAYPIKKVSDKNFTLEVQAQISSPTVLDYVASDETISLADLKTQVMGKTSVQSYVIFNDSASGINNVGTLPPKVNKPTDFTIHWVVTNYSTDVSNVSISGYLQSGVKWTGKVKSNISSQPTYNERTGEVNWQIDKILATKGVVSTPLEAIFQVEATPNVNQISQVMPLMGVIYLLASDDFTNSQLTSEAKELSTNLINDPSVKPRQGVVVP